MVMQTNLIFPNGDANKYYILNSDAQINFSPYLDNGITNEDSNWDDKFWDVLSVNHEDNQAYIVSRTMKTHFYVCTAMCSQIAINGNVLNQEKEISERINYVEFQYKNQVKQGDTISLTKFGGYTTDRNHDITEVTLTESPKKYEHSISNNTYVNVTFNDIVCNFQYSPIAFDHIDTNEKNVIIGSLFNSIIRYSFC